MILPDPDAETQLEPDFRVLSFQPLQGRGVVRRYQKRRTHHKSKSGCVTCKLKRVKVRQKIIPTYHDIVQTLTPVPKVR